MREERPGKRTAAANEGLVLVNSSDVIDHREAIGLRKGSLAASLEGAIRLLEIAARYRDLLSAKDQELLTQASDTIRGIEQRRWMK